MNVRIEERLPADSLHAATVLHVRRELRREIRAKKGAGRRGLLALLFGVEPDGLMFSALDNVASPIASAARLVANNRGVAVLGHDEAHIERCRLWLLGRKQGEPAFHNIIALDLATLLALDRARLLAAAGAQMGRPPAPLLLRGETGTGKELLTAAIHILSGRLGDPVPVHVSGMPEEQIYSTLFGHRKGAFTGAVGDREGLLGSASGGTILLDEVGDLPPRAQVGLLRVLQDGKYSRLGEDKLRSTDVRIIAATWRDLRGMIDTGVFRQDLYHRICAVEIELPALRDRAKGFRDLARRMLERISQRHRFVRSALDALEIYTWPGNLREMDGALRVAVSSAMDGVIRLEDLPAPIQVKYLGEPIEVRGPGLLCDDVDGLEVGKEDFVHRAQGVVAAVEDAIPASDLPAETLRFLEVFEGLPDSSGEHARLLESLKEAGRQRQAAIRRGVIAGRVASVATAEELPRDAVDAIRHCAESLRTRSDKDLEVAEKRQAAIDLRDSAWGRLFLELTEVPLLQGQNHTEILRFVKTGLLLVQSLDPAMVEQVRQRIRVGGVAAIQDWVRGQLIEASVAGSDPPLEDRLERPKGSPADWTAESWEPIVAAYNSRKELAEAVGITGRTLKKYLDAVGVRPSWARS